MKNYDTKTRSDPDPFKNNAIIYLCQVKVVNPGFGMKFHRFAVAVLVGILGLTGTLTTTGTNAGATGDTFTVDPPTVDLYLDDDALNATPPVGNNSKEKEPVRIVSGPTHNLVTTLWGSYPLARPSTFQSDTSATFWVRSDPGTIITAMAVELTDGATTVAEGTTGRIGPGGQNVLREERKIEISIPTRGLTIEKDLGLRILYWGTAVEESPVTAHVLYGSTEHPSRISFGAHANATRDTPTQGHTRSLYLEENNLTLQPPVGDQTRTKPTASVGQGDLGVTSLATSTAWPWGSWTADYDMNLVGDTSVVFWATTNQEPAIMMSLRVILNVGGEEIEQSSGTGIWDFANPFGNKTIYRFAIALDTDGLHIPAGTNIRLEFITWSSSDPELNEIEFLYGSTEYPSAVTFHVAGDPPFTGTPLIDLAIGETDLKMTPDESTALDLTLYNRGTHNATITIEVETDDDLNVYYPRTNTLHVPPNGTNTTSISLHMAPSALIHSIQQATIQATHDGVPLTRANVTVEVVREDSAEDETPGQQDEDEENPPELESLPGPGWIPLLAIAFSLTTLLKRTRTRPTRTER